MIYLVSNRVISPFCEGFIFMKILYFGENKTLAKIFEFTVTLIRPIFFVLKMSAFKLSALQARYYYTMKPDQTAPSRVLDLRPRGC